MIIVMLLTSVLAALFIAPGWFWFRRNIYQTAWLFALPLTGYVFWITLALFGVGSQGLGNFIELPMLALVAVVGAYAKFLLLDRSGMRDYGALIIYAMVCIAAFGFRLFFPDIPE